VTEKDIISGKKMFLKNENIIMVFWIYGGNIFWIYGICILFRLMNYFFANSLQSLKVANISLIFSCLSGTNRISGSLSLILG